MTRCRRCHRLLKSEPWQTKGIGKRCAQREAAEGVRNNQQEGDSTIIIPYDGGDTFLTRIEPERSTVSDIRTNIQRSIYRHSPTGFNFGYGGSGPADAALNCLRMFALDPDQITPPVYQDFKWLWLARPGENGTLTIPRKEIDEYLSSLGIGVRVFGYPAEGG